MDWHGIAGIVSSVLALATLVPYLTSTVWGTTRPSIISQSLWRIFALLAALGQYAADGLSWSMAVALTTAFNNIIIVSVCLFGFGYKGHTKFDILSGACALFGIILWYITKSPEYALFCAIIANVCAGIPTYHKTFLHPKTENAAAWILTFAAGFFSLIAASPISLVTLAFPLFTIFEAALVVSLIVRKH